MLRRFVLLVAAALVAALALLLLVAHPVVGPGPSASASTASAAGASTATPVRAVTPSAPRPSTAPTATSTAPAGSPTPTPTASASAVAGAFIAIDPALLEILPKTVAGSTVARDTEREAQASEDAGLAKNARALAAVMVGDNGQNIATAILVERRPEVEMATWFAAYRTEFDVAACDALGGPGSTSTRTLAGRDVEVTTCREGGTLLHVVVRGGSTILSVFELGPGEFGKVLLENLAPGA